MPSEKRRILMMDEFRPFDNANKRLREQKDD